MWNEQGYNYSLRAWVRGPSCSGVGHARTLADAIPNVSRDERGLTQQQGVIMKSAVILVRILHALAPAALLSMHGVAVAQESTVPPAKASSGAGVLMEEIMVTAQRKARDEAVHDVPLAISAYSGEQVEAMFADSLEDVGLRIPNVELKPVGSSSATASFFIRGMGITASVVSAEPSVGTFVDGVYLGIPWGVVTDLFDLESIEVLRGPQGTLFGRNVSGGAVLLNSRRPSDEFSYRVKARFGNNEQRELSAAIEGPLGETFAAKLAAQFKSRGDVFDNIAHRFEPTATREDVGEAESYVVRPILRWRPSDSFEATLITEFGSQDNDVAAQRMIFDRPSTANTAYPGFRGADDFQVALNYVRVMGGEWTNAILHLDWTGERTSLKSITGWRDLEQGWALDNDGSPGAFNAILDDTGVQQTQLSQEFTHNWQISDRANLTSGIYFFTQDFASREHFLVQGVNTWSRANMLDHTSWAVYAQADLKLTDPLTLTLGGRYTWEEKDVRLAPHFSVCPTGYDSCDFVHQGNEDWAYFTPRVALAYAFSDEVNTYLSWSKGTRSGGFQLRSTSLNTPIGPYDQEEVTAVEAGVKLQSSDRRFRANLAIFNNEYEDLQRVVSVTGTLGIVAQSTANAAAATVRGVELELGFMLTDNLHVSMAAGYTDAEYDEFNGFDLTGDGVPDPQLAKNLAFAHVPDDWTGNLSAVYSRDVSFGQFTARASVSTMGDRYAQENNSLLLPDYTLIDGSVSLVPAFNQRMSVSLYVKNAGNTYVAINGDSSALSRHYWGGDPRMYGVEVTYQY